MKKTVGIMTFHAAHNCGSILQAYAMQQTLKTFVNVDPEIIDFTNAGQRGVYAIIRPMRTVREVMVNASRLLLLPVLIGNKRSYNKYIRTHLVLSPGKYTESSLLSERKLGYDYYLSGSDQVWNITIADSDDAYFLSFVKNHPKIAYAVSQGAKDIGIYAKSPSRYKRLITAYDALSVRENNGRDWVENLTGLRPKVVLDPTLLLSKNDYLEIEEPTNLDLTPNSYIFVYASPFEKNFQEIVDAVAKKYNLPVVVWHSNIWLRTGGLQKGYILPKSQNPGKYLTLIKNARLVFTASFHGVVFAAMYEKDFWIFKNDGMKGADDRIRTLAEGSGLMSRMIDGDFDIESALTQVDYTNHRKRINRDKKASIQFLLDAFKK